MKTNYKGLAPALVGLSLSCAVCSAHDLNHSFKKMHERHWNIMQALRNETESFWSDFDALFEMPSIFVHEKNGHVFDSEAVKLPEIKIEKVKNDDGSFEVILKGISAKKDEVSGEYDEDEGYALFTFPDHGEKVLIKIYPRGIVVSGEKKITEEKKDEKGKVIKSSSYVAHNWVSETFPRMIDLKSIAPEYKDGVLKFVFKAHPKKRTLVIK